MYGAHKIGSHKLTGVIGCSCGMRISERCFFLTQHIQSRSSVLSRDSQSITDYFCSIYWKVTDDGEVD